MKLLIICQYYYPEQFQINEIAPELVRRGHEVTVLTGLPNYPTGYVHKAYKFLKKRHETLDGVNIIRCFEHGRKKGKLSLFLNYLSFAVSASVRVIFLREKYDVVLSYQLSPVTMVYPAAVYKSTHHRKLLLYCLDIWPESAQAHVPGDDSTAYKVISALSKKLYGACDRILVTSFPFIRYLNEKNNVPLDRLNYLPQHADDAYLKLDLTSPDNACADFMYAGNLGHGQVVEIIILAAAELNNTAHFKVHIVGDGSCLHMLRALVKEKRLEDKVVFYGNRSRAEMPSMYKMADALLITLRGDNFVGNTLPGKLTVYMTTGKPIFGAINGAAKDIIREAGCGACVDAGDYKGLAQLMKSFITEEYRYAGCGENARQYFKEHFTKDVFISALENELEKLC